MFLRRLPLALVSCAALTCSDASQPEYGTSARPLPTDPNLVIDFVDAPRSSLIPSSFEVEVSVCNRGGGAAPSSILELRLSSDATIDASDVLLASPSIPPLAAGFCHTVSVPIAIGSGVARGEHRLGVVADAAANVTEDVETDNVWVRSIGLGSGAALVIEAVDYDAGPYEGVTARICNYGTAPADMEGFELFFSVDQVLDEYPVDRQAALINASIAPGHCLWTWATGLNTSQVPNGTYYLISRRPEWEAADLIPSDDQFVAGPIIVAFGPQTELALTDLHITQPTQTLLYGTFYARVCNQGVLFSDRATLQIRSSTISYDDEEWASINWHAIPAMPPGGCHEVAQNAGWSEAPQFVTAELDLNGGDDNNLGNNRRQLFTHVSPGPDLSIEALRAPDQASGAIEVIAQVCNNGPWTAGPSNVRLYASRNERITGTLNGSGGDVFLGATLVPSLALNRCHDVTIAGDVSALSAGEYVLGAIVDEARSVQDRDWRNNTRIQRGFAANTAPVLRPDLEIASITAPNSTNGYVTYSIQVCNRGTAPAAPTSVGVSSAFEPHHLDAMDIDGDDIGSYQPEPMGALAAGACASVAIERFYGQLNNGSFNGMATVYAAARVGAVAGETNLLNNYREHGSVLLDSTGSLVDLVFTLEEAPVLSGESALNWSVCNRGAGAAGSVSLAFGLGADARSAELSPLNRDLYLWPQIAGNSCQSGSISDLDAFSEHVGWYVFGNNNSGFEDADPFNNRSAPINALHTWRPERLTNVSALSSNGTAQIVTTVCNTSASIAGPFFVQYYLTRPIELPLGKWPSDDSLIATTQIAPIAAFSCSDTTLSAPGVGSGVEYQIVASFGDNGYWTIDRGGLVVSEPFSVYAGSCGDGTLQGPEACDDGNAANNDGCSSSCTIERCGDRRVQSNETCDDGNTFDNDGCSSTCAIERCGDAVVQNGEGCDDGNAVNNDGCTFECVLEYCGDRIRQTPEGCDDGNNENNDGCSATCVLERCGDSIVQFNRETCDDGNTVSNDGCSSTCITERCGDRIRQTSEGCDDGNTRNNDGCSSTCRIERCGDGVRQTSEACDDGNTVSNDGCSATCVIERCGDGIRQTSEACDDGNTANNDGCSATCVVERCGDGVRQTSEGCDDGNTASNDGCSATCVIERCGDAIVQSSEACDDGNTANNDGCSSACAIERCGDGVQQTNEACDDGNTENNDGCNASCAEEFCGDGTQQTSEACDDGNNANNDGCNASCVAEFCGDNVQQTSEACDDGNNANNDGCSSACAIERCGDAIVQSSEACDDGNTANNDGCNAICAIERCGDGVQQTNEACDDGNNSNNDGCNASCVPEFCGDNVQQTGEACDDGNNANNDGCSSACAIERCGDGVQQTSEACDDGNVANGDGCSSTCTIEVVQQVCGDGVLQAPEACDDGNTQDGDGCGATCLVEQPQTPWATNEHGQLLIADGYDYVLGYNFTPLVDGYVTALGARVRGTKSVRLFHRNTRQELARADVTTNYQWAFTNIAPVRLTAGQQYIVVVYTAGTGGVFRSHVSLPITYGNIRIDSGAFESTAGNPNAFPYYFTFQAINGQADIRFSPIAR